MLYHQDILLMKERHQARIHTAEKRRLVRELRAYNTSHRGLYGQLLNWLGSRLVAWGRGLQKRYGTAPMPPLV